MTRSASSRNSPHLERRHGIGAPGPVLLDLASQDLAEIWTEVLVHGAPQTYRGGRRLTATSSTCEPVLA